MWISCYRIRNASACQGLAARVADVFVLSTSLHFHQCLDWEAERQQLIKFQMRISFSYHGIGCEEVLTTDCTGAQLQPTAPLHHFYEFLSAHWRIPEFRRTITTPPTLAYLIRIIISAWVYVNQIRFQSDMNPKIAFMRTMINVKGIKESPKINKKNPEFFKLIETSGRSDLFSWTSIYYEGFLITSGWGQQPLIPSDHRGRMGQIWSP